MTEILDLSYPITDQAPCTFGTADKVPSVSFEEGDSHGLYVVTSRLDNLYSNAGTQIDFPAHLSGTGSIPSHARMRYNTVGEYPLSRFVGRTAILDFSEQLRWMDEWFTTKGIFRRERFDQFDEFIDGFDKLRISATEITEKLSAIGCPLSDLTGLVVYSGSGRFWVTERFESWEYRYFYAPYLAADAIDLIVNHSSLSFIGVDALEIEDPVANFRGDELPLIVNSEARAQVRQRLRSWVGSTNHEQLLGNGVLIYESLRVPATAADTVGHFSGVPLNLRLHGLDDDALARPYYIVGG